MALGSRSGARCRLRVGPGRGVDGLSLACRHSGLVPPWAATSNARREAMLHRSVNIVGGRCPVSCGHGWTGIRRSGTADPDAREPGPAGADGRHPAHARGRRWSCSPSSRVAAWSRPAAGAVRWPRPHAHRGRVADRDRRCRRAACRRPTHSVARWSATGRRASSSRSPPGRRTARGSRPSASGQDGTGDRTSSRVPDGGCDPGRSGDRLQRAPISPPFYLYWSPDGQRLTFLTTESRSVSRSVSVPPTASAPAAVIRQGRRCTGRGRTRRGCSSTAAARAWPGSSARSDRTGSRPNRAAILAGRVPRPGRLERRALPGVRHARRGDATADRARDARSGRRRTRSTCSARPPSHSARVGRPGVRRGRRTRRRDVALPVGPLRLMDGASGEVRTLLDGTVIAFFWAPDGKTIAASAPGAGRRQRGRHGSGDAHLHASGSAQAAPTA